MSQTMSQKTGQKTGEKTPDILLKILERKREEIAARSAEVAMADLKQRCEEADGVRGFIAAIEDRVQRQGPAVIAEIKKASPSKGVLREDFKPADIAASYAEHGAACLSVLTDHDFFQGHEDYLRQARAACTLPVIRKDFIIDPYQVYEARAINADCILLIVAALNDTMLHELLALATSLNLDVLMEVHDEAEMERALKTEAKLIGVNNRNLRNFETALTTTTRMLDMVPGDRLLVTESGIHTPEDVTYMLDHNIYAFLVGEAFMRAPRPGEKLAELFGLD